MPTEVISTMHQLVAAYIKYKGILFTDEDSKIINDTNDLDMETNESEPFNNNIEITGLADLSTEITGVDDVDDHQMKVIVATQTGRITEVRNGVTSQTEAADNNSTQEYFTENSENWDTELTGSHEDVDDDNNMSVEEESPKENT